MATICFRQGACFKTKLMKQFKTYSRLFTVPGGPSIWNISLSMNLILHSSATVSSVLFLRTRGEIGLEIHIYIVPWLFQYLTIHKYTKLDANFWHHLLLFKISFPPEYFTSKMLYRKTTFFNTNNDTESKVWYSLIF